MGVSFYCPLSVLCVSVCVILNQSTSKKPHYVSNSVNLVPCCIKYTHQGLSVTMVPRFDICRSIISVSKIVHQMWCNHPFSQGNKTTKRVVWVGIGDNRERRGGSGQNLIKGGLGNIGSLHKIGGLRPLCQLC